MKTNPCRNCEHSTVHKGKHEHSWTDKCYHCLKLREHQKYLRSKRKFKPGILITNLDELMEQEWVYWHNRITHIEVIKNQQYNTIMKGLKYGCFYQAIRNQESEV